MANNASFVPSARDLLMVFPRLAQRAGFLAFYQLPEQMDSVMNKLRSGGSVIADATSANTTGPTITSAFAQHTAPVEAASEAAGAGMMSWLTDVLNFENTRGFGGMFSYFSSRWAITTFAVSIFLNRTHFYASSRQNLTFRWRTRLLLYLVPMVLLLVQTLTVLRTMRCQTSPDYPLLRYGDPHKNLAISFGGDGGSLYRLSSAFLFWEDDSASCSALDMSLKDSDKLNVSGSFARVWPFFVTLCISQFAETLACALQGRQPMPETGMSTFEHSLAFAECEAMISNALGLGLFSGTKSDSTASGTTKSADTVLLTRAMILRRLNVPSEVLLICFISCLSHLSSSILAITGLRQRCRLVNTTIWALCYMGAFFWSFVRVIQNPLGGENDLGILRFPTVCVIGFIPHLLILVGITVCACIYGLALLLTASSLPPNAPPDPSLKERFSLAFHNLQANVQFTSSSSIKLNWQEDFYTTILKVGFNILTAASEAVYLNEGSAVRIHGMTWLEEKRIQELARPLRAKYVPAELLGESMARGIEFTDQQSSISSSGYGRERKSRTAKGSDGAAMGGLDTGLGLVERRSRWQLLGAYMKAIATLVTQIIARFVATILRKLGVARLPAWLGHYSNALQTSERKVLKKARNRLQSRDFWIIAEDGSLTLPKDTNVDVEAETRQRLQAFNSGVTDESLDVNLYSWWKTGGWWGDVDTSGDYQAPEQDDDLTSVISMSTNASDADSDDNRSGQSTPTRERPYPNRHEPRLESTFGISDLARLLDPKSPEDREEAQLLSRHLQNDRPMTRSQYRRGVNHEKARLLTIHQTSTGVATELDEEQALENFILERRAVARERTANGGSWAAGAEGMGSGGPQCVVCQSSPRVVLVWPCGCLSICDDCRVGVAARNFSNCLCCRTNVVAYSRLYVP